MRLVARGVSGLHRDVVNATTAFAGALRPQLERVVTSDDPIWGRVAVPAAVRRDFVNEMQRFLPAATVRETVEQESYWEYLTELVRSEGVRAMTAG